MSRPRTSRGRTVTVVLKITPEMKKMLEAVAIKEETSEASVCRKALSIFLEDKYLKGNIQPSLQKVEA